MLSVKHKTALPATAPTNYVRRGVGVTRKDGAPGGTQTHGLTASNGALYSTELRALMETGTLPTGREGVRTSSRPARPSGSPASQAGPVTAKWATIMEAARSPPFGYR